MDPFELALGIGALITALVCWSDRRALMWIALGTIDFATTTIYARNGFELFPPPLFTGLFDATVTAALLVYGIHKWERALGFIFQFMVLVSFARLAGLVPDRFLYVVTLELANWLALAVVGGTHLMRLLDERVGGEDRRGSIARGIHRFTAFAASARTYPGFWSSPRA